MATGQALAPRGQPASGLCDHPSLRNRWETQTQKKWEDMRRFFLPEMVQSGRAGAALPVCVRRLQVPQVAQPGLGALPASFHLQLFFFLPFFARSSGWEEALHSFPLSLPQHHDGNDHVKSSSVRLRQGHIRMKRARWERQMEFRGSGTADFRQGFVRSWLGPGRRVARRCSYQDR